MSKTLTLVLKQLRNAAENLGHEQADKNNETHQQFPDNHEESMYCAKLLVLQLANAIQYGGAYAVSGRCQEFDFANAKRR